MPDGTEAGEVGREGVVQRRAEGGEQKEERWQDGRESVPSESEEHLKNPRTKELPLPLREGVGGRGLPGSPGPLPPTPSRKGRGSISGSASLACVLTRSIGSTDLTPRPRA